MSLTVNTNVAALNAHRWLAANDANMAKSVERLSSGFRINSAADDAAGLVISENLRTKISGVNVATANTQNGINMFKTAEGSLNEIESQLRNIRDLTVHAASQNNNAAAKASDQAQVNQALTAITRIATQTEFSGMKLFDTASNISGKWFQIGSDASQQVQFSVAGTFDGVALTADMNITSLINSGATASLAAVTSGTAFDGTTGGTDTIQITWTHPDGTNTAANLSVAYLAGDTADDMADNINTALAGVAYTTKADSTVANLSDVLLASNSGGNIKIELKNVAGNQGEFNSASKLSIVSQNSVAAEGSQFNVGSGATNVDSGSAAAGTVDISTINSQASYNTVLNQLDDALRKVNGLRVNLGAFQKNNLESNLASMAVTKENLSATESSIRDTDMAGEMVNFTKSQILTQAAQAMMTQANQAPQSILQMLR